MCFQWLSHQSHLYQELSKNYQPVQFSLILSPSSMDISTQTLFGFNFVSFCFRHITKSDCVNSSQWEANLMGVNTWLSKAYWSTVCSYNQLGSRVIQCLNLSKSTNEKSPLVRLRIITTAYFTLVGGWPTYHGLGSFCRWQEPQRPT